MPFLALLTLPCSYLPSLDFCCRLSTEDESRVYQAYSGWLRELHVGMYLAEYGKVTKDLREDLQQGIDWRFNGRPIAVRHEGKASARYWNQRKAAKLGEGTVVLTAPCFGSGVHLVSEEEISAKLLR